MSDYLQSDIMKKTAPNAAMRRKSLLKKGAYFSVAGVVLAGLLGAGYYVLFPDLQEENREQPIVQPDVTEAEQRKQKLLSKLRSQQKQQSGIRSAPIQAGNDQVFINAPQQENRAETNVPQPVQTTDKMILPSFTDLPETKEELQAVGRDTLSKVEAALEAANQTTSKVERLAVAAQKIRETESQQDLKTQDVTVLQKQGSVTPSKEQKQEKQEKQEDQQSSPESNGQQTSESLKPALGQQAYAVQIASYQSRANARNISRKLQAAGIETKFIKSGKWTIVRTSTGQSRNDANKVRQEIAQKFGIKPLLIKVGHETGQDIQIVAAPKLMSVPTQRTVAVTSPKNSSSLDSVRADTLPRLVLRTPQRDEEIQSQISNLPTGLSQSPPESVRDAAVLRPGQPEVVIVTPNQDVAVQDAAIVPNQNIKTETLDKNDPRERSPALQYHAGKTKPVSTIAAPPNLQNRAPQARPQEKQVKNKSTLTASAPQLATLPEPEKKLVQKQAAQPPLTIQETLQQADKSLRNNDVAAARRYYNDVLKRTPAKRPEYLRALTAMTGLIAEDSPVEALAFLREQETKSPNSSMISAQMAAILAGIGNINGAVAMQQQAVIREPGNPAHVLDLASLYERAGLQEQARQAYDIVLKSHKAKQELPDLVFQSAQNRYEQLQAQAQQKEGN